MTWLVVNCRRSLRTLTGIALCSRPLLSSCAGQRANNADRPQQDFGVKPQAAVLEIVKVVGQLSPGVLDGSPIRIIHLCPSCQVLPLFWCSLRPVGGSKPLTRLRLLTLMAASATSRRQRRMQVEKLKLFQSGGSQVPCLLCTKSADEPDIGPKANMRVQHVAALISVETHR